MIFLKCHQGVARFVPMCWVDKVLGERDGSDFNDDAVKNHQESAFAFAKATRADAREMCD